MDNILKSMNLIELQEELNSLAIHHQNKGGQAAHAIVKKCLDSVTLVKHEKETDKEFASRQEGFRMARTETLKILYKTFVP